MVSSKQKLILFSFQVISASFQSYYFCFIFFVVLWYHLFTVLMIENISYVIILDDEFMMAILPPFPFHLGSCSSIILLQKWGSDHLALVCKFAFIDDEANAASTMDNH